MFLTYPPEWRETYSQMGYVMKDPTVQWGMTHSGHVSWSELSKDERSGIFAHSARFGMPFGVTIATDEGGSRSLASFARADRDYDAAETMALFDTFLELHRQSTCLEQLSPATNDALRRLSVTMTHP